MTTFEELWERYGISEEFARKLYNEREYIDRYPKFLGDEEPEWEYLYVSDLGVKFAVTAGWGLREAIRELIQNALDACDDPSKIVLDVTNTNPMFFVIENPSKDKILFDRDITVGTSEKKCYERGMFGRGLKECASVILSQGGTIYIISHDIAYRFVKVPTRGKKYIGVLLGRAKKPLYGRTRVLVWSPGGHPDLYKEIIGVILFNPEKYKKCWQFDYLYTCTDPDGTEEFALIKVAIAYGDEGKLYVRDLYVNNMKNIFGSDSLFTYNTVNIPLEESRRNVADTGFARRMILEMYRTLYYHCPSTLDEIIDVVIKETTQRVGNIVHLKLKKLFEGDVFSDMIELADKLVEKIIEKYGLDPERTGIASQEEVMYLLPLMDHLRLNAIVTDIRLYCTKVESLARLISKILESDYKRAKKSYVSVDDLSEEIVRELAFTGVDPQILFSIFSFADTIKDFIRPYYFHTDLPSSKFYVSFADTKYAMGITHRSEIFVQYKALAKKYDPVDVIETIIHEYAHVVSGNAPDNTEAFTNALQRVSAIVINSLAHHTNWLKLVVAKSGYYIDPFKVISNHRLLLSRDYYISSITRWISDHVRDLDVIYIKCESVNISDVVEYVKKVNEGTVTPSGIAFGEPHKLIDDIRLRLELLISRKMEEEGVEWIHPITAMIFTVPTEPSDIRVGNLLVLSVKPSGNYFIMRDKLRTELEEVARALFSECHAVYVRFDVYNPYTNRYETYTVDKYAKM